MITEIFETLGNIINGVISAFVKVFEGISAVFYTPGVGESPGSLTIIGVLALLGLGFALARWGFNLVLRLIKMGR